jgi:hypothetical protein
VVRTGLTVQQFTVVVVVFGSQDGTDVSVLTAAVNHQRVTICKAIGQVLFKSVKQGTYIRLCTLRRPHLRTCKCSRVNFHRCKINSHI